MENPNPNHSLPNNSSPGEISADPSTAFPNEISLASSRLKLMISYNGRIQPRQHENSLVYVGGDTKLLAVDRSFRFPSLFSKLRSLFGSDDFVAKYQLPGEDLDSLISLTNEEDMENMMAEYDRICRFSNSKQSVRLRMFLFNAAAGEGRIKRVTSAGKSEVDQVPKNKVSVDYLFGLVSDPIPEQSEKEVHQNGNGGNNDLFESPVQEMTVTQVPAPSQRASFVAPQRFGTFVGDDGSLYYVVPAAPAGQGVYGTMQSAEVPQVYNGYYAPQMAQVSRAAYGSRPVYFGGTAGHGLAVSNNVAFGAEGTSSILLNSSRVSS